VSARHTSKSYEQPSLEDLLFPEKPDDEPVREIERLLCRVYRVQLVRESDLPVRGRTTIATPDDAAALLEEYLGDKDREHFVILMLDTKNAVIGFHTVSIGILDASLVHPREVFKPAILANAAGIIAAHNHPSGDPEPSLEDRRLTQRLVESGMLLGIPVLDHIVIGAPGSFTSLKQRGVM
jgi:DNA repair protein RadC